MSKAMRAEPSLLSAARPWVAALSVACGEHVEARARAAVRPLVEGYLSEWSGAAPAHEHEVEGYVDRVAVGLIYHWWRFVEAAPSGAVKDALSGPEEVARRVRAGHLASGGSPATSCGVAVYFRTACRTSVVMVRRGWWAVRWVGGVRRVPSGRWTSLSPTSGSLRTGGCPV